MMLLSNKKRTACFTGHRILSMPETELEKKVYEEIERAIHSGCTHFICGGAIGFDMTSAEQVICHRMKNKDITLEIALPCYN